MNLLEILYTFWGTLSGKARRSNAEVDALFAGFDYDAEVARIEALLAVLEPDAEAKRIKSISREFIAPDYLCRRQSCQGVMIKRRGRYGSFYSCSEYPLCRSTTQRIVARATNSHAEHAGAEAAEEESLYALVRKFGDQEGHRRWNRVVDRRKREHELRRRMAQRAMGLERLIGARRFDASAER